MDISGSVRIMESVGSTPKTKVSLISMQVTDCKVMNSAKELALHTIQSELIFGGTNGITYFNPAEITNSSKKT